MQHDIIMNCSFSCQKNFFFINLLGIRKKQISSSFSQMWLDAKLRREKAFFTSYSTSLFNCSNRLDIDTFIPASFNGIRNCSHMQKSYFTFNIFCLFADDGVKMNGLELHFYKVFWYKCFCKKLLERYLLERIKSFVRHLQFSCRTECVVCFLFGQTISDFGWRLSNVRPLF